MLLASIDFGKIASYAVQKNSAYVLAGAAHAGLDVQHIPNLLGNVTDSIVDAYVSDEDFEECFMDLTDQIGVPAAVAVFSEFIEDAILAEWESKALAG